MDSAEELYSAEQINIPVTFPDILKLYVKSAIRTQPYDLLTWTSAYFRALANDEIPPVKEHFDHPPFTHPTGLTPSYLRILFNQFGRPSYGSCVALKTLFERWQGMALSDLLLYQILKIGHIFQDEIDLYRFLAIACGLLGNNLLDTMIHICELLTSEPAGGSAMIAHRTLVNLYGYLASLDGTGQTPPESHEIAGGEAETDSSPSSDILTPATISRDSGSICTCEVSTKRLKNCSSDESCLEAGGHSKVTHGSGSIKTLDDDRGLEDCAHSGGETDEMSTEVLENDDGSTLGEAVVKVQGDIQPLPLGDYNGSDVSPGESSLGRGYDDDHGENSAGDECRREFYGEYSRESVESMAAKSLGEVGVNDPSRNEQLQQMEKSRSNSTPENSREICQCLEPRKKPTTPGESSVGDENFVVAFNSRIEDKYSPPYVDYCVPGIGPVVSIECVTDVQVWLMDCSRRQQGWVGPRNLRHFMCPRLFDESEINDSCHDCQCDQQNCDD